MGLFRSKGVIYRPVKDVNLGPDSTEFYLQANVKAPRMTGILVKIFTWFLESPILGPLLLYILKGNNLIHKLITNADLEESPLYVPSHHFEDHKEQEVKCLDSALTPEEQVQLAIECLPTSSEKAHNGTNSSFSRWTIMDYSRAYSSGEITPLMVAERFIAAVNESSKPPLRMGFFIHYSADDILRQANESTLRYKKGEPISVLDGVPVAIKDEMDCLPYPTTGGTKWLHRERPCTDDACCVKRLRLCGAILVGKTNMHELGVGISGINPHYGAARNPYDTNKISGGSSSGSATVVSAGLCPVALGVDGGGSVRVPASLCGVVGLKPTFGRVPHSGVLPLNWTVGMVGILAGTVEDALITYAAISGEISSHQPSNMLTKINLPLLPLTKSICDIKLAKYGKWFDDCSDDVILCCSRALRKLQDHYGWKTIDVTIPDIEAMRLAHYLTIGSECSTWFDSFGEKIWMEHKCCSSHFTSPTHSSFFFFFTLFTHFNHHQFMYTAEVFRVFAVRGGDASPAVAPATTTNCLKIVAFNTPTFRNGLNARWAKALTLCRCSVDSKSVGDEVFSVTQSNKSDVDYLGESTKGDLNVKLEHLEAFGIDGHASLDGPIEEVARSEARDAEDLLQDLGIPSPSSSRNSPRGIFCSRTLNLRSISAIGYDMDYTLIHYNVMAWEGRAYDYCMENLKNMGFPVDGLAFDPDLVIRGLVIDKEKGNLVKADRFGYIKRAMHGTKMLSTRAVSEMYGRELVDLRKESRWEFLNTLFSVSEAVAYMQMVDRLDDETIPADLALDYKGLYKAVGKALFWAHVEGRLKSEIMSKPELFVEPDPELPLALLDQKEAGKKLLLITNSDYLYTDKMMQHSFNRFLPNDMGWRDLFDIVIVSARKPEFFQTSHPMYEVVTGEGLMRPCFKAQTGGLYSGGSAQMVENSLDIHGDEILYVGDHIYTDVSQSKVHLRWRTALICRELEEEYDALIGSRSYRESLVELINQKEIVGDLFNQLRLALQRRSKDRPAQTLAATNLNDEDLTDSMQKLLIVMQRLDEKIAPMLEADGELFNSRWGFLSRAGLWDKSHLMRQIEKYADIYTSRVSNFLYYTPFMYFRSQEQNLAHDSYTYYCSQLYNENSS